MTPEYKRELFEFAKSVAYMIPEGEATITFPFSSPEENDFVCDCLYYLCKSFGGSSYTPEEGICVLHVVKANVWDSARHKRMFAYPIRSVIGESWCR